MKREILFMGKQKNYPFMWIEGFIMRSEGKWFIFNDKNLDSPDNYEVDPETVGQYTGLKDKAETKIFEGHVIQYRGQYRYTIDFTTCGLLVGITDEDKDSTPYSDALYERGSQFKIIGNIHDKPLFKNQK